MPGDDPPPWRYPPSSIPPPQSSDNQPIHHSICRQFFLVLGIVPIITAWYFIYKDAEQRKISKAHGTWSLLGIIGVAIYYFFFAKKHKIKKL